MSAGAFVRSRYASSYGTTVSVHPIRVQPETLALTIDGTTNAGVTTPLTSPISAQVSKGRRGLGLHARMVSIQFTAAVPDGYKVTGVIRLPLLNPAIELAAIPGAVGVYLGAAIVVVGFSPEVVK